MLCILFSVITLLVLSPATSVQGDNSCKACNCQFSNSKLLTDLIRAEINSTISEQLYEMLNNDEVLTNVIRAEIRNTYVPWTPVNKTVIGYDNLNTATTLSYDIPSIIPNTAQGVLLYSNAYCGYCSINAGADIKHYVVENGVRYEYFLRLHAYPQNAVNIISDNMWFPVPSNRKVYVEVPIAFPPGPNCYTSASVIGYR